MLYHSSQDNFPKWIHSLPEKTVKPTYTKHAKRASETDRYGTIILPEEVTFSGANIFEIEDDGENKIIKVCIRIPYNESYDIIFAFSDKYVTKTVWLNERNDNHKTLRKDRYK